MVVRGRNRDTAWHAIVDGEWPRLARAFAGWLEAANFAPDGTQRRSLRTVRAATG